MKSTIALPVTLRPNTSRLLLALPGLLIFAVLGVVLVYFGLADHKMVAVPFGVLFCLLTVYLTLNLRCRLTLTEQGFAFKTALRDLNVRWEDVEDFVVSGRLAVGWNYRKGFKEMTVWRKLNRGAAAEASIPGMLGGMSSGELAELMNRLRIARQTVSPLTPAQEFGLAAGAVLAEMNGHRHDCLPGDLPGQSLQIAMRTVLSDDWDVGGPEQVVETLRWLSEEGHRAEYEELRGQLVDAGPIAEPLALLEEESAKRMSARERQDFERKVACVAGHGQRHPTILAWDLCRLVSVARFGAGAGYLGDDDAWRWILEAANRLRSTFGSWREMSDNYSVGREFWGDTDSKEPYEQARVSLLDSGNTESPWNRLPWNGR